MGNKSSKKSFDDENKNGKINFLPNAINRTLFLEKLNKRHLTNFSDFSIEKLKNIAEAKYLEAMKLSNDNLKEKYFKLKEAFSYDNTNENIIREYLKIEKIYNEENYNKNIKIYYYHISRETYSILTGEKKKNSAIDLIEEIFNLFKNYNFEGKDYNNQCLDKDKINRYFYINTNELPYRNSNSIFNINTNPELLLYEIYKCLFYEVKEKISSIFKIILDDKYNIKDRFESICQVEDWENINILLEKEEIDKNAILLFNSVFFIDILSYIKDYILELNKTIEKCLKLNNL